jgi:hypothetical protein|tara:strand:+ start:711 stop:845 length:135 start_codon:yes stop_codon:yes gene_type:complete
MLNLVKEPKSYTIREILLELDSLFGVNINSSYNKKEKKLKKWQK